jgi:acyl transferase domain-containing protein
VLVDPVVGDFSAAVERVARSEPRLPIVSNVTGRLMSPAQATSPTYWGSQLRKTVQLAAGVRTLLEHADVLLELGPSAHLTSLIAGQLPRDSAVLAVPSMATMHSPSAPGASYQSTLLALGKLWAFGVEIDWYGFWGSPLGEHVDLPAGP